MTCSHAQVDGGLLADPELKNHFLTQTWARRLASDHMRMYSDDKFPTDQKKRPVDPVNVSEVEMLVATIEATARVAGPEESVADPADLAADQHERNHHVHSKTPTYKFLPNSGPQKIAHYIRELGEHVFREVIHPPSGGGTD